MKKALLCLFIFPAFFGCTKLPGNCTTCTTVKVTLSVLSCKHVGVIINGTTYPADDLPGQFAVEGKYICIEYSFWDDYTKCQCCGGRKVHIIAVH